MAISITRQDGVAILRMDRAEKKNALTGAMYDAMRAELENNDNRAVVFLGLPGIFTSGNDIGDFLSHAGRGFGENPAMSFIKALATTTVPMVAAVDGAAIGVGTTMLLHMDLVYVSPRALFKMPFVDLALVPEAGSSLLLPRRVGMAKAVEWIMLAESFGADEAARSGLANAVVSEEALEEKAIEAAKKLASKPKNALANARRLLRGDISETLARIEEESKLFGQALNSDEARTVMMAFMSKGKGA